MKLAIDLLVLLRPKQWLKNLMLLFPPLLGGALLQEGMATRAIVPLIAFCMASSGAYVLNDLFDASKDALHPDKKKRPIPSGAISRSQALSLLVFLVGGALLASFQVSPVFLIFVVSYLVVNVLYSIKLKELPIVDIFCISFGFLLRLQAGGVVFEITVSQWLFLSVFLLALFLSAGKRLGEMNTLMEVSGEHRKSLSEYPSGFLDGVMFLTGSAVLVTYTMYVVLRPELVYTVPLCAFGLLRYILRVKSGLSGDPTDTLLKDPYLFLVSLVWAVMIISSIYFV